MWRKALGLSIGNKNKKIYIYFIPKQRIFFVDRKCNHRGNYRKRISHKETFKVVKPITSLFLGYIENLKTLIEVYLVGKL